MPFDSLVAAALAAEISQVLPARVNKITAPGGTEIIFHLFRPGLPAQLLISMHPRFARMHLTGFREGRAIPGAGTQRPPAFVSLLRKHLEGTVLTGCTQGGRDRILELAFRTRTGGTCYLVAEIIGPGSNLFLLNGERHILGTWHTRPLVPARDSTRGQTARITIPGVPYEPPPPTPWPGVGPFATKEALVRAGFPARQPLDRLPPAERARLDAVIADLFVQAASRPQPVAIIDQGGRMDYWCLPPQAQDAVEIRPAEGNSLSLLLDRLYEERQRIEVSTRQRQAMARLIRRERQRLEKTVAALRRDLEEAQQAQRYRLWGELLLAQAAHLPPGQDRLQVTDYYQVSSPVVEIPLDPGLSGLENAQRYFRSYRKAKRGLPIVERRLARADADLAYLEQLEEAVMQASDPQSQESLQRELERMGLTPPGTTAGVSTKVKETRARGVRAGRVSAARSSAGGASTGETVAGIIRFPLPGGGQIMVGKGATANDLLTFVLARPDDIWLHARGQPGSHVIIRPPAGQNVSPQLLEAAARLAAHYSRARQAGKADVDWTLRKHVRRQPGGGPGQVFYRHEQTISVVPSATLTPPTDGASPEALPSPPR